MKSTPKLSGSHLRTYKTIFQHPVSHNLEWRSVFSLLRNIGGIEEEPNGNLKVTRNGQMLVLHPPRTKDVAEIDELMALRHFLERSETTPSQASDRQTQWLLVIDHQGARLFRTEMDGAVPQRILPHEPDEFFRHAHNSKDFTRGREKPDPNSFFEPVADALQGGQILVFGSGTGTSSEMEQFIAWTSLHHPDVAGRIVGSVVVDENHLTESQLLAKAREFYASARIT
jgi:hypothetical protein